MTRPDRAAGQPLALWLAPACLAISVLGCGAPPDGDAASIPAGAEASPLDGTETSFVIVGHSSSYAWPGMLQEMLDAHAGGERVYHVLNAVAGGAPVGRWTGEPGSEDYDDTFGAMLRDFFGPDARLRGDAPAPTVALCQQALRLTEGPGAPDASPAEDEGIRIGADALEKLAVRLHEHGVERVYFGMRIYNEPLEAEVGRERLALSALLDRGHDFVFEGPDLWTPTREAFPEAFEADGIHPNQLGMKVMAEQWYRTLAGDETRREIIDRLYATDYDVTTMMTDYINWRRP